MEHAIRIAAATAVAASSLTIWAHGNGWIGLDARQLAALVIVTATGVAVYFGARVLTTAARRL